jgi:hypothetical protein
MLLAQTIFYVTVSDLLLFKNALIGTGRYVLDAVI